MSFNYSVTFSLIEWLAITGFVQTILILVYIIFRAREWRQSVIPIMYFLALACAFGLQFSLRLEDYAPQIRLALWLAWSLGPPLCYLLILQVARLIDLPEKKHFLILLFPLAAFVVAQVMAQSMDSCVAEEAYCAKFKEILDWTGAMAGAFALLVIWARRDIFGHLWRLRGGHERYWLVIMLIITNILQVGIGLMHSTGNLKQIDTDALTTILGIFFVYLATTTLFRVYPPPLQLNTAPRRYRRLNEEEKLIAEKVRVLMDLDKVYQEPAFSRADLAREVGTSESTLSRVINAAFGKSFPQLLNELRVEDAKRMLQDPSIPIHLISSEAGFNSLASFNRVFRQITGETPSSYRAATIQESSI